MTDPILRLLNRAQAEVNAKKMIEATSPLLQEIVNYSTRVYMRCEHAGNTSMEDSPPFIFYLHIIEMTDGIQVLLSHSCCEPAVPLIRSSFEAFISLQYLFQGDDYKRKCLCWLYCDYLDKKRIEKQLDRESGQGKELERILNAEQPEIHLPTLSSEQLKYIHSSIEDPRFIPIKHEYERLKEEENKRPPWHRLFEGPSNLQRLASTVKMENFYVTLYRDWSATVHARKSRRYMKTLSNRPVVHRQLRFPKDLILYSCLSGHFILTATDLMILKFRPSERNHFETWSPDIRMRLQELSKAEVVVKKVRL